MNGRVFDNPKNWKDLRRLIEYLTGPEDIILDFFGGSASTAHAVLDLNAVMGSDRRFILVQIAELVPKKSPAAVAGYETIADIARDRIRRVDQSLTPGAAGQGFRAFRIDTTNMADVLRTPDATDQFSLDHLEGSVKPDRSSEDLLFQVLIDWGLELTTPMKTELIEGHKVFIVEDGALIACFDERVSSKLIHAISKHQPLRAVFRNSSFASDAARINAEQVFREMSPMTDVKAI